MCGICGSVSLTPRPGEAALVARMNASLAHRGPDDSGQYDDGTCSIAMRRLCVIDLATGRQPLTNEDETLVMVFNGEIYNYLELRRQLEQRHHRFRTQGDAEVITHLYEEHLAATPSLLHGMFAFCIYDKKAKCAFLARDRFGEKPLYYAVQNDVFVFSSEIDSLLTYDGMSRAIDYEALYYLLLIGYIPSPLTLFKAIKQVPAGHSLRWETGQITIEPYYRPDYTPDMSLRDERLAVELLRDTVTRAVQNQMVADVPLGSFLSGGIDSSTVVAAMQRCSRRPIKTFTARFEYAPFDESQIANCVADHLGTDHHEIVVTNGGFNDEDLWRIIRHFGQPFLDSSALPMYFVSREIRQHVTVALSGDGGDEIFAGYKLFLDMRKIDSLARIPRPLSHAAGRTIDFLTTVPPFRDMSMLRIARRAQQMANMPANLRPGALESIFDTAELVESASPLLSTQWSGISDVVTPQLINSVDGVGRLRQLMHYRLMYALPEDMLAKADRMAMAASLEVRSPLLSVEVTELAMHIPANLLIKHGILKHLLREVGRPWLPPAVYSHPKTGFTMPLHMFQNKTYRDLCNGYLADGAKSIANELFTRDSIRGIVQRGTQMKTGNLAMSVRRAGHQLWALLQLAAWGSHYRVSL